jgi:hypothetical protein
MNATAHAAGARTGPPPATASKGAGTQNTRAKHRGRACSPGWWGWSGARVHYDGSRLPDVRLTPTQCVIGLHLLCAEKQLQHGVTG